MTSREGLVRIALAAIAVLAGLLCLVVIVALVLALASDAAGVDKATALLQGVSRITAAILGGLVGYVIGSWGKANGGPRAP